MTAQNQALPSGATLAFGTFRLCLAQRALLEGDRPVRLGNRGLEILVALLEQPGEVVSKARLMQRIWPEVVVEEGTLRVHVAGLRKVLGEGHSGTRYIENVTRQGYRFVAPVIRLDSSHDQGLCNNPSSHSVPPALNRVIGRTEVVAALVAQVPKRRFVTIVGPGGIGKTTVAIATAQRLRSSYPHGVYCIDLAATSSADSVACAVASALALPVFSENPLPNVVECLRHKRLLLLLDNCEHVVASAARIAEAVLRRAGNVCILATSREPLRAEGEWVHRLPTLALPRRDHLQITEDLQFGIHP
jgi:DNA-binding winged helix-turn-helix (wHTH) protein